MKEIIDKLDFTKIKKKLLCKRQYQENEGELKKTPQAGRQYIWKKNCYLKYTKNG